MKKVFHLFPALAALMLFFSCTKDESLTQTLPPAVLPQSDSVYLDKMVYVNISASGIVDTGGITYYSYDNSKRVTKLLITEKAGGTYTDNYTYKYFYTGTDTLPYRCLGYMPATASSSDTLDTYYTYAGSIRVKDS